MLLICWEVYLSPPLYKVNVTKSVSDACFTLPYSRQEVLTG